MEKHEKIKRAEFLRSLGLSSTALMAFYCIGTLTSCGSDDDPDPGGGGGGGDGNGSGVTGSATGNNINFTVDLTHSNYSRLKTAGNFAIIGNVLVAITTAGEFVALAKECTHEGTVLTYRSTENDLHCSNHGSRFSVTGTVLQGPDTGGSIPALKAYKTTVSSDSNSLTVTS